MSYKLIANTKQHPLNEHLFAIGVLAAHIITKLVKAEKRDNLAKTAYLAGCWHDMGKIDPQFQDYLQDKLSNKNKQTSLPDEHPMHNEISFVLFCLLSKDSLPNRLLLKNVKHSIFWHHPKRRREEDLTPDLIWQNLADSLGQFSDDISMQDIYQSVTVVLEGINTLATNYEAKAFIQPLAQPEEIVDKDALEDEPRPAYKRYRDKKVNILKEFNKQVQHNTRNNLIRTALVTADQQISRLNAATLKKHIQNKTLESLLSKKLTHKSTLGEAVETCLQGFEDRFPESQRNKEQAKTATNLADEEARIGVLEGAAGCGKTKIALEWALKSGAQKIIWICPRVQICEGLLKQLTSSDYLPDTKIEICTGDSKYIYQSGKQIETLKQDEDGKESLFSGDIILTTIDQITNSIITHQKITSLVDYMSNHVVFDEFHEYITMPALNLMFAELVGCKKLRGYEANTLLVSATPNHFYLQNFLGITKGIERVPSFNDHKFHIHFEPFDETTEDETHPLFRQHPHNTIVISNTATLAQKSFVDNHKTEKGLLFHSKFIKPHKDAIFEQIMQSFGKDGTNEHDILRSGPIVQASLDISCNRMVSEMTSPDNMLQRMGRLDRFGLNTTDNLYLIAIPAQISAGKKTGLTAKFLGQLFSLNSAIAWYNFSKQTLTSKAVTLEEIYQLYQEFFRDPHCCTEVEKDLIDCLRAGITRVTSPMVEPVRFKSHPKKKEKQKIILKKYSLRGDSRYVQMAQCNITSRINRGVHYLDDYICTDIKNSIPKDADAIATLTLSVEELLWDRGENNESLLRYMTDKDYLIFPEKYDTKYTRTKAVLLAKSRYPETPIYTSYTQKDLGHRKNHEEAVYYAFCNKKPVGAITIKRFYKKGKKNDT